MYENLSFINFNFQCFMHYSIYLFIFQFLKQFKNACFYVKNSSSVCILHEILNDFFEKPKLEALVLKNMLTLYRFLAQVSHIEFSAQLFIFLQYVCIHIYHIINIFSPLQVHLETPILLPCDFFKECIIPKLHPEYSKIELLLECTHVSFFFSFPEIMKLFIAVFIHLFICSISNFEKTKKQSEFL